MRWIITLILVLATSPGGIELAEAAVHVAIHGDLPHHDEDSHDERGCSEHTCTPLRHQCGCHAPMFANVASRAAALTAATRSTTSAIRPAPASSGRASDPPPLRPPIG